MVSVARCRLVLAVAAVAGAAAAGLLWSLRGDEATLGWLWPALWAGGAAGSAWCAVTLGRRAFTVSLVGLACGALGRSLGVVTNSVDGRVAPARAALGVVVYFSLTAMVCGVWLHVLLPPLWRVDPRRPR